MLRCLTVVALVLSATTLAAQNQKPGAKTQPPQSVRPYVPAIMQPRQVTLAGCLQHKDSYILSEAMVAGASEKEQPQPAPASAYALEGLAGARLSLLVGKRVTVTGAYQEVDGKPALAANGLARFEATNAIEEEGATCQAGS